MSGVRWVGLDEWGEVGSRVHWEEVIEFDYVECYLCIYMYVVIWLSISVVW